MRYKKVFCLIIIFFSLSLMPILAHDIPPRPDDYFFYDEHETVVASASAKVKELALTLKNDFELDLSIIIIGTNGDEPLTTFAERIYHDWKLSARAVMLVLAKDDHKSDIWVSGDAAAIVPVTVANNIQNQKLFPLLAGENYSQAAVVFAEEIVALAQTQPVSSTTRSAMSWPTIISGVIGGGVGAGLVVWWRRERQKKNT